VSGSAPSISPPSTTGCLVRYVFEHHLTTVVGWRERTRIFLLLTPSMQRTALSKHTDSAQAALAGSLGQRICTPGQRSSLHNGWVSQQHLPSPTPTLASPPQSPRSAAQPMDTHHTHSFYRRDLSQQSKTECSQHRRKIVKLCFATTTSGPWCTESASKSPRVTSLSY
jgi:hypothetical protein